MDPRVHVTQAEWWSESTRQKYTTTAWTQDNTAVAYQLNPRPTESNVYDASNNRRRTRIEYFSFALPSGTTCNLPADVYEYQSDAATVYRRTRTDYITDAAYLARRIIGLPSAKKLYDGGGTAQSITLYRYDWASHLEAMPGGAAPPQHDTGYNTTFTVRGNLVSVQRISTDPNDPPNTNIEFKWAYNTSGSVTLTRDMRWHQQFFSYTDNFADGVNRNTFAYPTTVSDADGNNSSAQYRYDLGAVMRTQGPPPAGNTQGAIQAMEYDAAGRIQRVNTVNNSAYRRYVYGSNYVQSFATVRDLNTEDYAIKVFDGAGRVRATAAYHIGSAGGYTANAARAIIS